jgi:hypothetical protein
MITLSLGLTESGLWMPGIAVGIATGYGLDNQGVGVQVLVGSRIFSASSRWALGPTQLPIQWVLGGKVAGA